MWTVPLRLKKLTRPSLETSVVTALLSGGSPAVQFRFAAVGRGTPAGKTVRNELAVGAIAATLRTSATASAGIVQFPCAPCTAIVCVSLVPIGVERAPTVSGADRVSMIRHGVIGTNTAFSPASIAAEAGISPP